MCAEEIVWMVGGGSDRVLEKNADCGLHDLYNSPNIVKLITGHVCNLKST